MNGIYMYFVNKHLSSWPLLRLLLTIEEKYDLKKSLVERENAGIVVQECENAYFKLLTCVLSW